jgi:acyl dehydratase
VTWEQGQALEPQTYSVTRADLVAYAGASGDLNPIHWSDRVATSVGLPGVVAHGMYTMALAARALTAWAGGPGRIAEFGVRFTRPVLVPDDDTGTTVEVAGTVTAVENGLARVTVAVTVDGVGVLGQARAQVRVDAGHG